MIPSGCASSIPGKGCRPSRVVPAAAVRLSSPAGQPAPRECSAQSLSQQRVPRVGADPAGGDTQQPLRRCSLRDDGRPPSVERPLWPASSALLGIVPPANLGNVPRASTEMPFPHAVAVAHGGGKQLVNRNEGVNPFHFARLPWRPYSLCPRFRCLSQVQVLFLVEAPCRGKSRRRREHPGAEGPCKQPSHGHGSSDAVQ
jgi:hypothetical protein